MNFVALFQALDCSQSTLRKKHALVSFIEQADPMESGLGLALLLGHRLPHRLPSKTLKQAAESVFLGSTWLFEACYTTVGDLSETLAILLGDTEAVAETQTPCLASWVARLEALKKAPPEQQTQGLVSWLQTLSRDEAFLFLKLSTGGFRLGVSQGLVHESISMATGIDRAVIDERLMGGLQPDVHWFARLKAPVTQDEADARPVPFLLAHSWQDTLQDTLAPRDLAVEYKWDGIRCQLIKTDSLIRLWSRGDQDITAQFPDITGWAATLPSGLILDGEIIVHKEGQPRPFNDLQVRLNRKRVTRTLLASHPALFRAYDCLRFASQDLRDQPHHDRRTHLDSLGIETSPLQTVADWDALKKIRASAREQGAEGLMIKHRDGHYTGGRKSGLWWKWKLDPMTADCVLLYAQAGHGRRAALHTDFTLAVWQETDLIPVAKAYSGLTNEELKTIDRWIKAHTTDKFGPVRQVKPELVFEIGFEGIARSTRHKSGIALRFPRILRWRTDLTPMDADHLSHFDHLLDSVAS